MQFRLFIEFYEEKFRTLLVLEFNYDDDVDWYEVRVFRGEKIIGYVHGYGNRGWSPQVNNIWVAEEYRRRGLGTIMMTKVEDYFGQVPLPGTPIEDNDAAKGFWKSYLTGRYVDFDPADVY